MSLGPWRSWLLKDHVAGGLDLVLIGQEKLDFPINITLTILRTLRWAILHIFSRN